MNETKKPFDIVQIKALVFSNDDVIATSSVFEGIEDDLTGNYDEWVDNSLL